MQTGMAGILSRLIGGTWKPVPIMLRDVPAETLLLIKEKLQCTQTKIKLNSLLCRFWGCQKLSSSLEENMIYINSEISLGKTEITMLGKKTKPKPQIKNKKQNQKTKTKNPPLSNKQSKLWNKNTSCLEISNLKSRSMYPLLPFHNLIDEKIGSSKLEGPCFLMEKDKTFYKNHVCDKQF